MTNPRQTKSPHFFCITCPSEDPKGGDVDYTNTVNKILNDSGIKSEYYIVKTKTTQQINETAVRGIAYNITNFNGSFSLENFIIKLNNANEIDVTTSTDPRRPNIKRLQLVNAIINNISNNVDPNKETPVLNLQLRFPQTGTLILPHDLDKFKRMGVQVIVTCHEYLQYNAIGFKDTQKVVDEYLKAANNVIFFNEQDRNAAIQSVGTNYANALRNKSKLSAVPPTIHIPEEQLRSTQEKPGNILFFGLIRDRKEFEFAIPLAQAAKNEGKGRRIIIAGNPINTEISTNLKYLKEICDLPLDFRFGEGKRGLEENEFAAIFNEVKYAMVFDNFKGFSHNSSAAISLLANVPILFTNKGATTPSCLLKEGANAGSVIFIENNPSKVFECIQKIESNLENVTKIRKQADYFLKEHHSPEAIVSDFTQLLNIPFRNTNTISVRPDPLEQDFYETGTKLDPEWTEVKKLNLVLEPEILQSIMDATGETKGRLIKAQQVLQLLEVMIPENNANIEEENRSRIIDFCENQIKASIAYEQAPSFDDDENEDVVREKNDAVGRAVDAIHNHFFSEIESNINLELISNEGAYRTRFSEFSNPILEAAVKGICPSSEPIYPLFDNFVKNARNQSQQTARASQSSTQQSSSSSSSSSTSSSSSNSSACTNNDRIKARQVIQLLDTMYPEDDGEENNHADIINFCKNQIINDYGQSRGPDENVKRAVNKIHEHFFSGMKLSNINVALLHNKKAYQTRFNEFSNPVLEAAVKGICPRNGRIYSLFDDFVKNARNQSQQTARASQSSTQQSSSSSSNSSNFENRSLNKEVPQNNLQSNIPQNQVASGPQKRPRAEDNFEAETEDKGISGTEGVKTQKQSENDYPLLDIRGQVVSCKKEGADEAPENKEASNQIVDAVEAAKNSRNNIPTSPAPPPPPPPPPPSPPPSPFSPPSPFQS